MAFALPKMTALISPAKVLLKSTGVLLRRVNQKRAILQEKRHWYSSQKGFLSTASNPKVQVYPEFREVTNGLEIKIPIAQSSKTVFVDYLWLYDHCRCPKCYLAYTNQKEVDPRSITENVAPQKVDITKTELQITWSDGHAHNYNLEWIMENIYEGYPRLKKIKRIEWNASLKESDFPTVVYDSSIEKDDFARQLLSKVFEYGFCLVENAPKTFEATEDLYRSIIPIQKMHGQEMFTIQVQEEYPDNAFTNTMLPPHNDGTYLTETPGLIALNCLLQSESGGESFFADGKYVANLLQHKNPEAYNYLCTTPIESNYMSSSLGLHFKHCETVLRLHPYTKELLQIRYNTSDICPVKIIPQREIRKWYRAMAALAHELCSPDNQIKFSLGQGRMYIIDNWTLVHGRMSFNGQRKLAGCFMGHKDFYSRGRVLGLI